MTKAQVILHFGTQLAVAKRLGITQSSVAEWGEYPPPLRQMQLEKITKGRLRAEPSAVPSEENSSA